MLQRNDKPIPSLIDAATLTELTAATTPALMRQIIDLFIEETCERIKRIEQFYAALDWSCLQNEMHSLKSAAATFGVVRLKTQASALEKACREQQTARCHELVATLPKLTQDSLQALKAYRDTQLLD